jgi:hypothetical protein
MNVVGMRQVGINGEPGTVFEDHDGRAIAVVALNIADDQVQTAIARTHAGQRAASNVHVSLDYRR